MRRRITLVLSSLLTVVALAVGGLLLDPAGSRGPSGTVQLAHAIRSGPGLYSEVARRMAAERTVTYTFSGTSGGGEIRWGTGSLHFLDGEPPAAAFDGRVSLSSPSTGQLRAILLPDAVYLALPRTKGLPQDRPWLEVAESPTSTLGRQLAPVARQLHDAFDPGQSLGLLRAAAQVEEVGPDSVEGVPATEHRATVDLRHAALLTTDTAVREQYRAMVRAGVRSLRFELWLDSDGLPRRLHVDVPATQGLFSVTGVFRRWGEPVDIQAPTAKHVFDADRVEADRRAAVRRAAELKARKKR